MFGARIGAAVWAVWRQVWRRHINNGGMQPSIEDERAKDISSETLMNNQMIPASL